MEPVLENPQLLSLEEHMSAKYPGVQSTSSEAMSQAPRSKSVQRRLSRMSLANEHGSVWTRPHTLLDDVAYSPGDMSDESPESDPSGEEPEEYSDLTIAGPSPRSQRRPSSLVRYRTDKRPIYVQTRMNEAEPATNELATVSEVPDRREVSVTNIELSSPSVRSEEELRGEERCCCCACADEFRLICCGIDFEGRQDEYPVEERRPKPVPFSCTRYCARNLCDMIDDD